MKDILLCFELFCSLILFFLSLNICVMNIVVYAILISVVFTSFARTSIIFNGLSLCVKLIQAFYFNVNEFCCSELFRNAYIWF